MICNRLTKYWQCDCENSQHQSQSKQTPTARDPLMAQAKERHLARRLDIVNPTPQANQRDGHQNHGDRDEAGINIHTRHYTASCLEDFVV